MDFPGHVPLLLHARTAPSFPEQGSLSSDLAVTHPADISACVFAQISRVLLLALEPEHSLHFWHWSIHNSKRLFCTQTPKCFSVDSAASADSAHKMGHYSACSCCTTPVWLLFLFLALECKQVKLRQVGNKIRKGEGEGKLLLGLVWSRASSLLQQPGSWELGCWSCCGNKDPLSSLAPN